MVSWRVVALALLLAVGAFVNSVPGEFVSDDDVQIARNPTIQNPNLALRALGSDVWGFGAGDDARAWSNYWRPMFVLSMIVNFRLFGLQPAGWHVMSLALHCLVVLLVASLLGRLRLSPGTAACILWVFAVHPAHVESVAWISGSPDLLLAVFLLGAYVVHLDRRGSVGLAVSLALYVGALASKETAFVFPALIFATEWARERAPDPGWPRLLRRALYAALPYAVLATAWLGLRALVVGLAGRASSASLEPASILLSAPRILGFYMRQIVWPWTLSPVYPVRAISPDTATLLDYALLPLTAFACTLLLAILWRAGSVYALGAAWFALPLLPAFNIGMLEPLRIVQDRYLYLPLLGALLVLFPATARLGRALQPGTGRTTEHAMYGLGLALAVVFAVQTARYNLVWQSDVALWKRAVRVRPDSAEAWGSLGFHYRATGRTEEARRVLLEAERLGNAPAQVALDLALIDEEAGRPLEAERRLRSLLDAAPDYEPALDHLGRILLAQGRAGEAAEVFREARARLPHRRVKNTVNLALAYRELGQPDRAIAELESIGDQLAGRSDPRLVLGLWHLAELYRETGRPEDAGRAYAVFLRSSRGMRGAVIDQHRHWARQRLGRKPQG